MCPREYQVGKGRRLATEATRARILAAAKELIADPRAAGFTVDAVAERADVARMTVYYQFKSRAKLLEALFDDLGSASDMQDLRKAFQHPEPARGLGILIETFCHLWETQRPLVRRLNAFAALDPEIAGAMKERNGLRRDALVELLGRRQSAGVPEDIVDVLHALTSFETFDALATAQRSRADVAALLERSAVAILESVEG
jgi:AcrR family transcriptional regulator